MKLSSCNPKLQQRIIEQLAKEGQPLVKSPVPLPPAVTAVTMLAKIKPSTDEGELNKWERDYLAHMRALLIPWIGIQCITFKLAHDTRITPDFSYVDFEGRMTMVDVKGWQREDALIKMRVAARQFPMFDWQIVKKTKDGWDVTKVKP